MIKVACGSKHMMALTNEKNVYSWGSGEGGQLGHGNEAGLDKPQLIASLRNLDIIFIAAGDSISGAIDLNGQLWLWGMGNFGRLGLGTEENINMPKPINDASLEKEKMFFVALGFYHTICATGKYLNLFNPFLNL